MPLNRLIHAPHIILKKEKQPTIEDISSERVGIYVLTKVVYIETRRTEVANTSIATPEGQN